MTFPIRSLYCLACAVLICGPGVEARELDREKTVTTEQVQVGQGLPRTLVVRRRIGTNRVEIMHSSRVLRPDSSSRNLLSTSSFIRLNARGKPIREIDRDSSSSSWWWFGFSYPYYSYYSYRPYYYGSYYPYSYYPYSYYPSTYYSSYYYPTYSYYGYNYVYRPYYGYNWGGYNYSYYGWPYYNNYCSYY